MNKYDQLTALCGHLKWTPPHFPASLCGWTDTTSGGRMLSDPLHDLDACREMEKYLDVNMSAIYDYWLSVNMEKDQYVWNVTAKQKVEAFLRTFCLWRDC